MLPRIALLIFLALTLHAQEPAAPLTSVKSIRDLDRTTAARSLPVEVRGIITAVFSPASGSFIIDDGDSGIYVSVGDARARGAEPERNFTDAPHPGMHVEVTGVTAPGGYAPTIIPKRIHLLGTAPLPPVKSVAVADLLTGRFDCERVRVRGVVQHITFNERVVDAVRLELTSTGGHFVAYATTPDRFDPNALVDSEVDLSGVALSFFNERAELVGARVQMQGLDDLTTIQPAPETPFAAPEVRLEDLLPFSPNNPSLHRRRIRGTVTVSRPGAYFYVQEGDRAVRVTTRDPALLSPGDRLEVAGFVEVRESFAELREAVFRHIGTEPVPPAEPITRAMVLDRKRGTAPPRTAGHLDGRRVVLTGRLERMEEAGDTGRRLSLDVEGHITFATLANDEPRTALKRLVPGSDVSVTGVCQVQLSVGRPTVSNPIPTGFQLIVQSPADIEVLRVPPWWTPQRLWFALGLTALVLALALGWAWLLRLRVAQRSAQLAAEIGARQHASVEFEATLRERKRLAADLHDTLEQALTGLALQLEAVELFRGSDQAERSSHHLRLARQFLQRSREDVRRSVWNLRAQGLEGGTLIEALREMVAALTEGQPARGVCEVEGRPIPLPDFIAGNLLLLAQEALTNAVKHAAPQTITVRVSFAPDSITLVIQDDGRGFDPASAPSLKEGHFGLQGMRERIKRLGGTLEIASASGTGTRIIARIPTTFADTVSSD